MNRRYILWCFVLLSWFATEAFCQGVGGTGRINREAVVRRHNPHVQAVDTMSALTVGNGHFAFTVDITGLQTFPKTYSNGMPLGTMSDWGWHSFPNEKGYKPEETWVKKSFGNARSSELYAAEFREEGRQRDAANYLRQNPHRLHLGCVGLNLPDITRISAVDQHLDMWKGLVDSRFCYDGRPFHVQTVCSPDADLIASKVETKGKVEVVFRVPYPTGRHSDDACDWDPKKPQTLTMERHRSFAWLTVRIDDTAYQVRIGWNGKADIRQSDSHTVVLSGKNDLDFSVWFVDGVYNVRSLERRDYVYEGWKRRTARREVQFDSPRYKPADIPNRTADSRDFRFVQSEAESFWQTYWKEGGIVDFSNVADSRAKELERRVVLSQYLLAVNDGGDMPPQETGLTYNSWFGKFHLEMIWWHQAQFALWGHPEMLERSLNWYFYAAHNASEIAIRQEFDGLRWMKMTDPWAGEAPSNVGSYLIWQQPHIIYLAELLYRAQQSELGRNRITSKFMGLIDETALFMNSFASFDQENNRYVLKGCIPAQETLKADSTLNPPLELSYWYWGLRKAKEWRLRFGNSPIAAWDQVADKLPPLACGDDSLYLAAESAPDTYSNIRYTSDHPAVLGALGMLPESRLVDKKVMRRTLDWVMQNWNWDKTWGWDYPMTAMCAARLGCPDKAVDALLMPCRTNTYLLNGHNYQDQRLRVYLPGNGGLLTAVAMMLAGWDGSEGTNPGFPADWDVRWEGLLPMP